MAPGLNHRDRHGRGLRRPIPTKLLSHGFHRGGFFKQVVSDTCEYLKETFSEELGDLKWRVEEVPYLQDGDEVRRWSAKKSNMTITLYRIPIERFGKKRIPDPRIHIEQAVISAAASLIDKDPWELIHPD
ncbi:MAG TPA: hypothetical protein VIB80_05930 [Aquiluna sp.]